MRSALLLALVCLGIPARSAILCTHRSEVQRYPIVKGAQVCIQVEEGTLSVQGWDREEMELQADFLEGPQGTGGGLEVRSLPQGGKPAHLLVALRRAGASFRLRGQGCFRVCHLTVRLPYRLCAAMQSTKDGMRVHG